MKNSSLKFGLIILLTLRSAVVFAVWYQVEMIVFENLYPNTDGESWYQSADLVPLDNTVTLLPLSYVEETIQNQNESVNTKEEQFVAYKILPDDNNRLDGINRVLRLSREYRPIYHISWQQPGLDLNLARPVHVQAEDNQNLYELTIPPLLVKESVPADFYEPIKLLFDGTIQIRSSLYLHVDLDMVLFRSPPVVEQEQLKTIVIEDEQQQFETIDVEDVQQLSEVIDGEDEVDIQLLTEPVDYVRLTESRRIKLNELHYFDHPLFGIILQVSRFGPE